MVALPLTLAKEHAIQELAREHGVSGIDAWNGPFHKLFGVIDPTARPCNAEISFCAATDIAGVTRTPAMPASLRHLPVPDMFGATPIKEYQGGKQEAPALDLIELPGGAVLRVSGAPVIVGANGTSVAQDVSSKFAPLLHFYDFEVSETLADARHVPGTAMVVMSDIGDGNYCHWLLDELPRVAVIRDRPDVRIIMAAIPKRWRRETLRLLGIGEDRIVEIGPNEAARADTLLVPSCTQDMQHVAHKGAHWVIDYLRDSLGLAVLARQPAPEADRRYATRLYVGRDDVPSRRLLNEAELMRVLEPAGFVSVTMGGRSVAEQIALFARAELIVALHGASLANIVFCAPGTRLVEIFTQNHSTPAYAIMAGALDMAYASLMAEPGSPTSDEKKHCRLDVPAFWQVAEPWLRQSVLP